MCFWVLYNILLLINIGKREVLKLYECKGNVLKIDYIYYIDNCLF